MVPLVSYIVSSIVKFFSFGISFPLKSILYYFFFFYFGTCMAKRTKPIEKTVESYFDYIWLDSSWKLEYLYNRKVVNT